MSPLGSTYRLALVAYGLVLGMSSLWLLVPELARSAIVKYPTIPETVAQATVLRDRALSAARLAQMRGDLWGDAALAFATPSWRSGSIVGAPEPDEAMGTATQAVRLKPINSAVWLLIARLGSDDGSARRIEALKMSYYTGPNETALIPLRMALSAHLDRTGDSELERLLRSDLDTIWTHELALKSDITSVYQQASAPARNAIRGALEQMDPVFSQTLPEGSAQ